jgi:hypothetical protein
MFDSEFSKKLTTKIRNKKQLRKFFEKSGD